MSWHESETEQTVECPGCEDVVRVRWPWVECNCGHCGAHYGVDWDEQGAVLVSSPTAYGAAPRPLHYEKEAYTTRWRGYRLEVTDYDDCEAPDDATFDVLASVYRPGEVDSFWEHPLPWIAGTPTLLLQILQGVVLDDIRPTARLSDTQKEES